MNVAVLGSIQGLSPSQRQTLIPLLESLRNRPWQIITSDSRTGVAAMVLDHIPWASTIPLHGTTSATALRRNLQALAGQIAALFAFPASPAGEPTIAWLATYAAARQFRHVLVAFPDPPRTPQAISRFPRNGKEARWDFPRSWPPVLAPLAPGIQPHRFLSLTLTRVQTSLFGTPLDSHQSAIQPREARGPNPPPKAGEPNEATDNANKQPSAPESIFPSNPNQEV